MSYARPSERKVDEINIENIINKVIKLLTAYKTQSVNVHLDIEKNLPLVKGNEKEIMQVFLNLMNNAIHAMENGGDLTVSARCIGSPAGSGRCIEIKISDTGSGISEENINKVFDPFFTTKRPGKGTGLGLSVCMRIIDSHKGTINIGSQPNKGTTITTCLPV